MWKIEIFVNTKKGRKVLTSAKYETEEQASAAAEQLRLINSPRWTKVPRHEKEDGTYKFKNYSVTNPKLIKSN